MLGHALQVLFFSATLHSDAVKQSVEKLCHNPTWVDLKVGTMAKLEQGLHLLALAPSPS